MKKRLLIVLAAGLLTSCAGSPFTLMDAPPWLGGADVADGNWLGPVLEQRRRLVEQPGNLQVAAQLRKAEQRAADRYYQRGASLLKADDLDGAAAAFQQGLIAMPTHPKLRAALQDALARREAEHLYADALRNLEVDRRSQARRLLQQAAEVYPRDPAPAQKLEELEADDAAVVQGVALPDAGKLISLSFNQTPLRRAFNHLGAAFGVDLLFDPDLPDAPVTLRAERVTLPQALELMQLASRTFYRQIGPKTLLIALDTDEKRTRYDDQVIRTFQLNTIPASDMAAIVKGLLSPRKMVVNEESGSIVIRDSRDVIGLVEQLVDLHDRRSAELLLELEILEVNRDKVEQLGLDWYSQADPSLSGTARQDIATLPNPVFRKFKRDVGAKILASPRMRAKDNRAATFHVGDRVPLRTATEVDADGQKRTNFEYHDVGTKLKVLPRIHRDNSTTLHLNLEVSSIGRNLGTPEEPLYAIGTRSAETIMLLRDGETAILGGLIRGDEARTEVILTVTPRVLRGWSTASPEESTMYSGTEHRTMLVPPFETLREVFPPSPPQVRRGVDVRGDAALPGAPSPDTP